MKRGVTIYKGTGGYLEKKDIDIMGKVCNKIADLVHVVEAPQLGSNIIVTTDRIFEDLTTIVSGPTVQ